MVIMLTLVVLLVVAVWFVRLYNQLQNLAQAVKGSKANIMAAVKKRADLANRLADIARSYGDHEKLTQITASNNMSTMQEAAAAAKSADSVLNQVASLAMAFPDLKANATYQQLMAQIDAIEQDIQTKREAYNLAVREYNVHRSRIPQTFFAASIGFPEAPYFNVDEAGVEQLGEFNAGDSEALRATFRRMGERAGEIAGQTTRAIGTTAAKVTERALEYSGEHRDPPNEGGSKE